MLRFWPNRPETEKPDTEFALNPSAHLQTSDCRLMESQIWVATRRKSGSPCSSLRDAFAVVADLEIEFALFLPP